MKKVVLFCAITVLLAVSLHAADDPVKKGMQLYKKHHYEDAGSLLLSHLYSLNHSSASTACMSLGMVYLSSAELYSELCRTSISVHLDYLARLDAVSGKAKSLLVKLYLAQAFLEAEKPDKAASIFQKFIAEKKVETKYKEIAKVGLGSSYYLQNKTKKAKKIWSSLKTTDPEVLSGLAKAYCKAGLHDKNPLAICDKALELAQQSSKTASIQVIKNVLWVYAATGQVVKGLDLIKKANLKSFSHEEAMVKNKIIRFYDLSLLSSLSVLYGKASLKYLNKAAEDAKVKNAAQYYLGIANARLGNFDESIKVTEMFLSSTRMPPRYRNTAKVMLAESRYLKGDKEAAKRRLENLAQTGTDPYLLSDILLACSRLQIERPNIVKKASVLANTGDGKRFAGINFALGKYYLWKKNLNKAASFMEAGRDKSNKNRIEYNNPLMLVNLAQIYYRTKKFSEALEIYFEISKQFPAVRQIQVAMQGVYSMEQKSAGDAKLF